MNKILFLGRFSPPMHGAARMNELYYDYLRKKYIIRKIKINYSLAVSEIGKFNVMKFFGIFIVFFKLLFQLISYHPNLVYFEIAPRGFAFYRDSAYVLLCKLFRRKIVFSSHARGAGIEMKSNIKKKYYRFIFKNTKIILLSKLLYPEFEEIYDKKNIYFLANGIKDELTDDELAIVFKKRSKNKKKQLLFLSNMIKGKGSMDTLELCLRLKNEGIQFECNFIGVFDDKKFEKKWFSERKRLGLSEECKYLGAKYGDEKKEIMEKVNFLVFPTRYPMECYPLVILESFMFGIPILSYDTGAIKEIISNDFLGFVSKKRTVVDFLKFLKRDYGVKEWSRIRKYFKKNYTIEIAGGKLDKIIKNELK